jgi:ketosteroid isomerase-like protein
MRKFPFVLTIAIFMISCNQNKPATAEEKTDSTKTEAKKIDTVTYPYKAAYSSAFEIGKSENAKIVLDIWKAYQDNKMDDTKGLWADSVIMQFDGATYRTNAAKTLEEGKKDRAQYTSVIDTVVAFMPLHSIDKNEDWVAVWGNEYTINKKGKKDTVDIHEIWQVKDGKVAYMAQYRAHRKP